MKITCLRQTLVDAVLNVQKAVSAKSCLTALEGVLIKTKENSISLCGYDLELGITTDAESVKDYTGWYTYSNAGMGVCLTMAEEMGAYILSDKATFLTFRAAGGLM